ncbi:hypothetical protein H2248_010268 [Termitomyces sp. 'cryptogamus']|nr:hypothetical protein H2248_010268 [Termitomyces sp. 'cryptogamus']
MAAPSILTRSVFKAQYPPCDVIVLKSYSTSHPGHSQYANITEYRSTILIINNGGISAKKLKSSFPSTTSYVVSSGMTRVRSAVPPLIVPHVVVLFHFTPMKICVRTAVPPDYEFESLSSPVTCARLPSPSASTRIYNFSRNSRPH